MIYFYVKFLICFNKPEPPPKKEPKAKQAKFLKNLVNKVKEVKEKKIEVPIEAEPEMKDKDIIECIENAREWCHVEYSLFDGIFPKVEINVVTWGDAAKVFTTEDCRAVKTVVIDNLVWIYFEVAHKVNVIDDELLVKFKESKIMFKFSQDTKKMMPAVVNDWPKQFTYAESPTDTSRDSKKWFSELLQIDPPEEKRGTIDHKIESFKISRPDMNSIVTMLTVKLCEKSIESKVRSITPTLPIAEETLNVPKKGKAGKKVLNIRDKKTDKKGKGDKFQQNEEDNSQLFVKAELIIAGKYNVCAERKEIPQTIRYAAVFVNSSKVLTDEQDDTFVPLVINIQALEALPLQKLQQLNVKKVYARYELAGVLKDINTQSASPDKNIILDDIRVFFLSNPEEKKNHETLMLRPSMLALAEALMTRRFVVKIYGEVETPETEVEPCIFGDRPNDPFISTPGHDMFLSYTPPGSSAEIYLGSACFNLIQLVKGYTMVEVGSILTSSPLSSLFQTTEIDEILNDTSNAEERKALLSKISTPGPILESVFLEHCTAVKLKISTYCRLTILKDHELLSMPQVCHRAIVILKDHRYNNRMVDLIEATNRMLLLNLSDTCLMQDPSSVSLNLKTSKLEHDAPLSLGATSSLLSDGRTLTQTVRKLKRKLSNPQTLITGFLVEHEEESILVIEAITFVIPPLIEKFQAMFESEDYARVICDSSIFFTKRLYTDFYPMNIFRINLSVSLNSLLKHPVYYKKESMENEALQTLLLLDLLRRCRTINGACVYQLFPSCNQLIGFCKEFGCKNKPKSTSEFQSAASFVFRGESEAMTTP